jgi:hypothetical protein
VFAEEFIGSKPPQLSLAAFPAAAQSAEAWMNARSEALLIGNSLKKSGQLLTLALRERCAE